MISLGIICYQGHSSSAAIIEDGKVLFAVSEERFTRIKHDDSFPINSILFILKELQIKVDNIDEIAIAWSVKKTIWGQFKKININSLGFILDKRNGGHKRTRLDKFFKIYNLKNEIRTRLNYKGKITYLDHHLSHALCSYVQADVDDAIIFVADGMGESAATSIYHFKKDQVNLIYQDDFPNSLGIFYSAGTQFLNFIPDGDEFKVMGLAAYGKKSPYLELMKQLYAFKNNHFILEKKYFDIQKSGNQFFSFEYKNLMGKVLSFEERASFAFALQATLEEIVLTIIEKNQLNNISKNFCSAGGVFLNCLLNQKIREKNLFKSCNFYPISDDNGTCIGAAQQTQIKSIKLKKLENLYLGPKIIFDENLLPKNLKFKKIESVSAIAQLLADGNVVAWAQDRMEFGHRALGNRSILADPRKKGMKEAINAKVKYREEFRPFAPAILDSHLKKYFDAKDGVSYEFMIETLRALPLARENAPAVVHEDGTSRVQSVTKTSNPTLYLLLEDFYHLTNCPILLNTSLNLNGMPIALNFRDALECFAHSEIDYLVVNNYIVWR